MPFRIFFPTNLKFQGPEHRLAHTLFVHTLSMFLNDLFLQKPEKKNIKMVVSSNFTI